jgi:electron transport complex protein RnfC
MAEQRRKTLPMIPPGFERRYRFHGGLKLAACREKASARPIKTAGIPAHLVLPLQQHIGEPAECLVSPGDTVYKGQLIAQAVGRVAGPLHRDRDRWQGQRG